MAYDIDLTFARIHLAHHLAVDPEGVEPSIVLYKSTVLPLNYGSLSPTSSADISVTLPACRQAGTTELHAQTQSKF